MNVFYMDFKESIKESIVYLIHTVPPRPSPALLFGFKFEPKLNYKYRAVEYTVQTHSLFLPVDRLEHVSAGQLEHGS